MQQRGNWPVASRAPEQGVLLRPLGNVVYFMPPYVIRPEEIHLMAEVAWEGIQRASAE